MRLLEPGLFRCFGRSKRNRGNLRAGPLSVLILWCQALRTVRRRRYAHLDNDGDGILDSQSSALGGQMFLWYQVKGFGRSPSLSHLWSLSNTPVSRVNRLGVSTPAGTGFRYSPPRRPAHGRIGSRVVLLRCPVFQLSCCHTRYVGSLQTKTLGKILDVRNYVNKVLDGTVGVVCVVDYVLGVWLPTVRHVADYAADSPKL